MTAINLEAWWQIECLRAIPSIKLTYHYVIFSVQISTIYSTNIYH